ETRADCNGFYIPFSNAILMTGTHSPRAHMRRKGIPEDKIEQHIPRLNTISDVVWEQWKSVAHEPGKLRFYAIDTVVNEVSSPLLDYLFRREGSPQEMAWEDRLTFGLDTDEGKALFGAPNGIAVAWLLTNHHGALGRRDPRVSIFRGEGKRHMIWELIPEGKKSTFDDYVSKNGPIRQ
ncbi:MAG: hypothetical protein Q9224_007220, partial [Gallowayella concinna]